MLTSPLSADNAARSIFSFVSILRRRPVVMEIYRSGEIQLPGGPSPHTPVDSVGPRFIEGTFGIKERMKEISFLLNGVYCQTTLTILPDTLYIAVFVSYKS